MLLTPASSKAAFAAISQAWVVSDFAVYARKYRAAFKRKGGAVVRAILTMAPAVVSALTGGNVRALPCSSDKFHF